MAKKKTKVTNENKLIAMICVIIVLTLSIITLCQFGIVGKWSALVFKYLFGNFYFIQLILAVIGCVYYLFYKNKHPLTIKPIAGWICLNIAVLLLASIQLEGPVGMDVFNEYVSHTMNYFYGNMTDFSGGLFGAAIYGVSSYLFEQMGSIVLGVALVLISLLLLIKVDFYHNLGQHFKDQKADRDRQKQAEKALKVKKQTSKASEEPLFNDVSKKKKSVFISYDEVLKENQTSETISSEIVNEKMTPSLSQPIVPTLIENDQPNSTDIKTEELVANGVNKYTLPSYRVVLDPMPLKSKNNINETSAKVKGAKVIEILSNFGIKSELIAIHIGPAVTKFEIKPDSSVKVSKIMNIQDNIKMELAARDIRIEAPIPGKSAVGIEIPNVESVAVKMVELINQVPDKIKHKEMLFVLGKDLMGAPIFCELDKMPHLLIAGATGSGKSVCMNTIITSFLLRMKPSEVKLLLIDPKKVEFTPYHNIPHLIGPVISDAQEASNALKIIVTKMEERFDLFAKVGVRNIQSYNEKVAFAPEEGLKKMPFIVVIIDELADLMAIAGKEVEMSIQRITQLARASGIHLIVATQRPSTDVITGIIKSNIPSRISFAVASGIDSRTIIDSVGAERLLGNGDMLYLPIGTSAGIRLQGVYVSDDEVKRITDFVKAQERPFYDDAFIRLEGVTSSEDNAVLRANDDPLYDEIKAYVIELQKASTSLLQRRFGIGYNRAARMIDVLEENGVIGPVQGSKPRDVYIQKQEAKDE